MVADLDALDALADRLDDARALVAHDDRRGPRPVAVDHVQVGMADAARAQLDEHLAAARALERELLDRHAPGAVEHRRPDAALAVPVDSHGDDSRARR